MPEIRVEDVASLQPYSKYLKRLAYRNTDHFVGAAQSSATALAAYLGINAKTLDSLVSELPRRKESVGSIPSPKRRSLGVRLDRIPRRNKAFMVSPGALASLPASTNLMAEMEAVRDQGDRLTCVAFASTAVAQHYWRSKGQTIVLSPQYLYWSCKQHDGDPTGGGTWIAIAMAQLESDGCCLEATWPYVAEPIAGNESQNPPPASAIAEAAKYKIPSFRELAPTSVADIKGELAQDRCVAFTIPVFNSWYENPEVTRTGEIVNPIPNEQNIGGHAMCFVGYKDAPDQPELGGGKFFIRNSWNGEWATESVLGTPGYGTIPYSYISQYGEEAYSIN